MGTTRRARRAALGGMAAVALAVGTACAKKGSTAPVARQRLDVHGCVAPMARDPLEAVVVERAGTALVVRLNWLGGCTQHRVDACWYVAGPDDLRVVIGHDAHGEACTSWVERFVELDLSAIPEDATRGRLPAQLVQLELPRRR